MKKTNIAIFALIAGLTAYSKVAAEPAQKQPAGEDIYKTKCASCHGTDGKGNPNMKKIFSTLPDLTITTEKKSDQELIKTMTKGKNKMPAYEKTLTQQDMIAVLGHIRSLAAASKKAPAQPTEPKKETTPKKGTTPPAAKPKK